MLTKRIIPCLDIREGRTVKGIRFQDLKDAGDPVELAARYADQGADELVFLDITATLENRSTLLALVKRIAKVLNIPFTVGGGIRTVDDVRGIIDAGADKISLNSAAVKNPDLISGIADEFGKQCVVVAVDVKKREEIWEVHIHSGKTPAGLDALGWSRRCEQLGAGEILLTSMNQDGTGKGFALDITARVAGALTIPVIASGGAGSVGDFVSLFKNSNASAALAAGVFHFNRVSLTELKQVLIDEGISIR